MPRPLVSPLAADPAADPAREAAELEAQARAAWARAGAAGAADAAGADAAGAARAAGAGADSDQAGMVLLIEAAHQWRLAGNVDRCRALLATVIERGGEAGCFARAALAGSLLEAGAAEAAYTELATLAADPALTEGPCELVGELLIDHGAPALALEWYDRVLAGWSAARRAAATQPSTGRPTIDQVLLQQHQRIRKRLGFRATERG